MDRRRFLQTSLAGALAAPLVARAQQAGKVYRVGYLSAGAPSSQEPVRQVLVRRLSDLGWIESRNFVLEARWAEGRNDRLPTLAAELVQRRVDVIVAVAEAAVLAAKNATRSVPIVMLLVGDPVGSKLVASLARPGGNVRNDLHPHADAPGQTTRPPQGGCPSRLPRGCAFKPGESIPCT